MEQKSDTIATRKIVCRSRHKQTGQHCAVNVSRPRGGFRLKNSPCWGGGGRLGLVFGQTRTPTLVVVVAAAVVVVAVVAAVVVAVVVVVVVGVGVAEVVVVAVAAVVVVVVKWQR